MKVVVINGSPRRDGLVSQMLGHVAGALPEGCEVETLFVRDMQVRPCTGCMKCRSLGRCVLPEDDAHRAAETIRGADALIAGTLGRGGCRKHGELTPREIGKCKKLAKRIC